ncbi:acyl-CoA dehydrogenase domain protein [Haloterrigena turkmenica DSM 5511]|uniref:Acyl-CoA dehydrogenase domain protein n=1 Tax=Haloterrigena turkmenica (strain ATCC 51198 / DSM 5511 / JCM 9101 / NCIMB 13204 / VKM B-1734 / 4k) TaxID=543526 RepID=D2RW24_HALTV|nr:acyl-CoA dehydrogenase family protein [Haloterrigena turkmenica]ADB61453.1 acyl-CoA dehydrogenase domain protein [Haloterrigena turkmenica DSM 5511]
MERTDERAAIRDVVREFATEEIRPVAAAADESQSFPEEIWDGLAELDLTGLTVPEAYGGYDADPITAAIVNEEVAYGALAVATALSVHSLATSCIAEFGNDAQRERWLPEMAAGRPVGAFALSEPHAGSNPAEMATEASREGDEYVINGEKQWITNGQRAGVYILFAKTDRDDPNSVTQFLVPGDVDGLSVGEKEDKLGLRASDTTSLTFDDVRIPVENRLTEEGKGLSAAFHILTGGRIAIAAQSVGLAQCALDEALAYSQEREQFGDPIAEIQSIRHKLAEMATRTKAARSLTRHAARTRHETDADGTGALEASMAKYFASETAMFVTNEAVQIHGGYGYVTEGEVERLYRDAKITEIYEGTTEIQKTVIARELLD